MDDSYYMKQALLEAHKAGERGEVPVGAVVVCKDRIIARAHNLTETLTDVTAHAEFLQLSGAEGWMEQTSECYIESGRLCFSFSLPYNAVAPASCMEEVHGTTTEYPVIRILTDNANCPYKWAQQLIFDSVEIKTEVNGIRNFSFYNDLGEVDTTRQIGRASCRERV